MFLVPAAQDVIAWCGVSINPLKGCWYWILRTASFGWRCSIFPYLPSSRPLSFLHPQKWTVRLACKMERSGIIRGAWWPALAYHLFSLRVCAYGARITRPRSATSHIVELDEKYLPVPVPHSSQHLVTPDFMNRWVVYSELSWADIWVAARKERTPPPHAGSKREEKPEHQPERKSDGSLTPMTNLEVEVEVYVIDTTVPTSSGGLPENAMNPFATV